MSYITDENGNYRRTVTCGHCYDLGHNQGSCKKRKESLASTITEYERKLAEDDFKDDWERGHTERWLTNNKSILEKINNRGKNRKCSYCTGPGHTRRTCKKKKGDMNDWATKALFARQKFAEKFEEAGLGVGALLNIKGWRENSKEELAIVEDILWEHITHEIAIGGGGEYRDVVCSRTLASTEQYPRGESYKSQLLVDIADINGVENFVRENRITRERYSLASPVDASFPDDFLTIPGCLRAAVKSENFEKARPYDYYNVDYDEE